MRLWFAFFLALLLPLGGAEAAAPNRAAVTAWLAPDGIDVDIRLDRAVSRFDFADTDVVREGDFELLTPGLTLNGNSVTAPAPFRGFRLHIRPAAKERDAKYPAHFRVGAGGVLYAPALKADPAAWRTRLVVKTRPGEILTPSSGKMEDGFVFIGPAVLRRNYRDIVVIADPATPAWLVETSQAALATAVAAYTRALGASLPRKPLLIIRHRGGARSFNVGDVTPGGITSLRFYGDSWNRPDEKAARTIRSFVLHEAFHFWNGGLAHHDVGTPSWLHEGGAEYASLLAGVKGGVLSEEEVRRRLSDALDRCRFALQEQGDKGLARMGFLTNQVRYPCGMVLQWAADLHLRRASGGRLTLLDAWAETIRAARARPSRAYGLADFYKAARIDDPAAFAPVRLLVDEDGPARWSALPAALSVLGAEVAQVPTTNGRRGAMLFHLLRQNCRSLPNDASIGFYSADGRIKLQTPAGCGVLAGDPVLKSIEGGDPSELTAETYAAVQRKCAAKTAVTVVTGDGRTLAAACASPLGPEPQAYLVKSWMPGIEASQALQ
ncbi:MAG: hypothetical protein JWO81_2112 [Alphaproteobacteria bacterium]|nr:hypothetical protein [Alphaproteobacteria bacterium]